MRRRKAPRTPFSVILAAILAMLASGPLVAMPGGEVVGGIAVVRDGDTLEIGEVAIRLHGIDAPEAAEACPRPGGAWPCGAAATRALARIVAGRIVACARVDTDVYGRMVATCRTGGVDLGARMTKLGLARAAPGFSDRYVPDEAAARAAGRGIWTARKGVPGRLSPQANAECAIKGNIGAGEDRIYHLPGSRWYDDTRISAARGERWFCDEAAARQAGWRRAGRR